MMISAWQFFGWHFFWDGEVKPPSENVVFKKRQVGFCFHFLEICEGELLEIGGSMWMIESVGGRKLLSATRKPLRRIFSGGIRRATAIPTI